MRFTAACACLLLLFGPDSVDAQAPALINSRGSAPVHTVNVTANLSVLGATIPPDFVGISTEVGDFVNGFFQGVSGSWTSNGFTGNAASFVSLVNLLGSHGVFRIGGGTAEVGTAPVITAGMATNLNNFLGGLGAGWTLIYGLDLKAADSATAATTASNISSAVGTSNVTFQFGNEPSLNGFTAASYETTWNSYYTAVTGSVSGVHLAAVDDIINPGWGSVPAVIAALTPGLAGMTFVSAHWYPFCSGMFPTAVPAILLSQIQMQKFTTGGLSAGSTGNYLTNTTAYGSTPQRMTETNSLCSGGQAGMSDRLLASAWFLNTAVVLANAGWAGINVHTEWRASPVGWYNPFVIAADHNFIPSPVFYAMYMFSKISGQQMSALAFTNGSTNIAGIATKGSGGNANILAVNNDVNNAVSVKPDQSAAWTTANVLLIKDSDGNGCASASPVVGGQPIGESGAWSGAPFAISNGASIQIPPCGAALIQIQP